MVKMFREMRRNTQFTRLDALSLIMILKLKDAGPSRFQVNNEMQFYSHNSAIKFYKCYKKKFLLRVNRNLNYLAK